MIDAERIGLLLLGQLVERLQWGRVVIDAESSFRWRAASRSELLQWGRVVIDAESVANRGRAITSTSLQWGRVVIDAESTGRALPQRGR